MGHVSSRKDNHKCQTSNCGWFIPSPVRHWGGFMTSHYKRIQENSGALGHVFSTSQLVRLGTGLGQEVQPLNFAGGAATDKGRCMGRSGKRGPTTFVDIWRLGNPQIWWLIIVFPFLFSGHMRWVYIYIYLCVCAQFSNTQMIVSFLASYIPIPIISTTRTLRRKHRAPVSKKPALVGFHQPRMEIYSRDIIWYTLW